MHGGPAARGRCDWGVCYRGRGSVLTVLVIVVWNVNRPRPACICNADGVLAWGSTIRAVVPATWDVVAKDAITRERVWSEARQTFHSHTVPVMIRQTLEPRDDSKNPTLAPIPENRYIGWKLIRAALAQVWVSLY